MNGGRRSSGRPDQESFDTGARGDGGHSLALPSAYFHDLVVLTALAWVALQKMPPSKGEYTFILNLVRIYRILAGGVMLRNRREGWGIPGIAGQFPELKRTGG
jgi:hypothetical protein